MCLRLRGLIFSPDASKKVATCEVEGVEQDGRRKVSLA